MDRIQAELDADMREAVSDLEAEIPQTPVRTSLDAASFLRKLRETRGQGVRTCEHLCAREDTGIRLTESGADRTVTVSYRGSPPGARIGAFGSQPATSVPALPPEP